MVRAIAILAHPIPNTDNAASAQIILPQRQTGRKNDIYVFCSSSSHHVCAADKWLAFVSTIVETTDPERELLPGARAVSAEALVVGLMSDKADALTGIKLMWQSAGDCWWRNLPRISPLRKGSYLLALTRECLIAGLALLGPIEEKFVDVTDLFVPTEDGTKDKAFISRGGLQCLVLVGSV